MEFLWPVSLVLLGLIPVMIGVYAWILRRRKRYTVRYSSLALVRAAIPRTAWLRRHLPFSLFLLSLALLVVALSRPTAKVAIPSGQATVILALDVSRSMCSTDIPPNRLKAAKAAVLSFIDRQDMNTSIGIVAFAGFAAIVQPPTTDQDLLREAVKNLTTARRTAIGSGILKSLDAIAELNGNGAPSEKESFSETPSGVKPDALLAPAIIIVLSDGASNSGPLPLDAAQQAVERGVRIYTIGYGTASGSTMDCGDRFRTESFSGGGGQGSSGGGYAGGGFGWYRRGIDEETLIGIAEITGGEYYSAASAGELHEVFKQLPTYLITQDQNVELSVLFAAMGLLFSVAAIMLSMVWHPLP